MTSKRPTTVAQYIQAAPAGARPHLRLLHAILKEAAPDAQEVIKWGTPFFVEPRFLFAFSAHKAHCNFAPMAAALAHFREELAPYKTTKNYLQIPYGEPVPQQLVRRIAAWCVQAVRARQDDGFW